MFKAQFTTDNAAFDDSPASETAMILRHIAAQIESGEAFDGPIRDSNGNRIGQWTLDGT